jgi:hypothetical protein
MLPEDRDSFLAFLRSRDPVVVVEHFSQAPKVEPVETFEVDRLQSFCLWNKALLPVLTRKHIRDAYAGPHYRVDEFKLPVLEFSTSFRGVWDGKPALGQGRVYGIFDAKSPDFEKWYEAVVRWIRKNFHKNLTTLGGYVGPAAYKWFKMGGYLLPTFSPPTTGAWLRTIRSQH